MQPAVRNAIARIDVMLQGKSISRRTGCLIADGLALTALHGVAVRTQQSLTPYPGEVVLTFPGGTAKASIFEPTNPPSPSRTLLPWIAVDSRSQTVFVTDDNGPGIGPTQRSQVGGGTDCRIRDARSTLPQRLSHRKRMRSSR